MASPEVETEREEVRNINERVKIPAVIESLRGIFSSFGEIQDVIAKKSLKRKGQAFVVFDEIESAQDAIDEINGFELFGQQLSVEFAKTRSDVTVLKEDGEEALEAHKKQRLSEKERKQAEEAAAAAAASQQQRANKRAAETAEQLAERPAKVSKVSNVANKDVPDEYLPPNKTLTLRELPDNCDMASLVAAFGSFAGYKEVRAVPGRPLAFVEFEDDNAAAIAKQATANLQIDGKAIRITFRRS